MDKHNFQKSLELSQRYADAAWWMDVYRLAFPSLQSAVCVRADGWAQRGGIDRVLTLGSGKTLTVDEKVRAKNWPDIALEYWSSVEDKKLGWVAKDLACDFIAYAFVPSETCYLLPFHTLRRAWRANGASWIKDHRRIDAANERYTTRSVGVPIPELLRAISDATVIHWGTENEL